MRFKPLVSEKENEVHIFFSEGSFECKPSFSTWQLDMTSSEQKSHRYDRGWPRFLRSSLVCLGECSGCGARDLGCESLLSPAFSYLWGPHQNVTLTMTVHALPISHIGSETQNGSLKTREHMKKLRRYTNSSSYFVIPEDEISFILKSERYSRFALLV